MSVQTQRGKVKSLPRIRNQRPPINTDFTKGNPTSGPNQQDGSMGIFSNADLTYLLGRHCIGNIGEVTTVGNDKVLGVIKAISPSGDMGLGYTYSPQSGKNGHLSLSALLVPMREWKMVRIPNVQLSDCLMEAKPDFEANESESPAVSSTTEELVPFFASSDTVKDCVLDQGGFPADEMFKTNKELFSVSSTYDPELSEYTTPVDKTAPNFSETEARCDKLARDIEGSQPSLVGYDEACDDEEMAFSAVSRPTKDSSTYGTRVPRNVRMSDRPVTNRLDSLSSTTRQMAHVSIHPGKSQPTEASHVPDQSSNSVAVCEASRVNSSPIVTTTKTTSVSINDAAEAPSFGAKANAAACSSDVAGSPTSTIASSGSADTVMKKSTLDPNAPEFQPMGLQYIPAVFTPISQPTVHHPLPGMTFASPSLVHPAVNANDPGQIPVPTLTALVAAPQPQLYAPSSIPYGSHTTQLPQVFSPAIPSAATNSVSQQMRGGSLPPSLHQSFTGQINPGLLFQQTQPGISMAQLTNTQSPLVAGPNMNGRFSVPVSLARQRSGDPPSTSAYGSAQPNISVSTFPSMYQFSQPGGGIPLWLAGHHMGLHFVPGAGNSSTLMLGNIPLSQTSGQPIYSAHTMLQMQPTQLPVPTMQLDQATVPGNPQHLQHHPLFPTHAGQFQDPPHHVQLPQYAPNLMFPQQPPAANYYPTGPSVLTGPNGLSHSVQSGMLPVLNVPGAQHPANGVMSHQPPTLEQSVSSNQLQPQFSHSNCQPAHMQHFGSAHSQLLQAQQLAVNQHMNSQPLPPGPYANIATLVANAANTSQAH